MKLIVIIGPAAVGKMTVGIELEKLTGLKLFHNHMTVDLVNRLFDWGDPKFHKLVKEFRLRMFEEVSTSSLPGMIFTYMWAFDRPEDKEEIDMYTESFKNVNAEIYYVELFATQEVRLKRNVTELRLANKIPKRDVTKSEKILIETDKIYKLNTQDGEFFYKDNYIKIDNTNIEARDVALQIVKTFKIDIIGKLIEAKN